MRYFIGVGILLVGFSQTSPVYGASYEEFPISIATGDQLNPDVVWDGTNFWVVWTDEDTLMLALSEICKARVAPNGQVETHTLCGYGILPFIATGDTEFCVAWNKPWRHWDPDDASDIEFKVYNTNTGYFIWGEEIEGYSYFDRELFYYIGIPVFGENHFFLFAEYGFCVGFCCHACCGIFGLEKDSVVDIANVPTFQSGAITGIWDGEKFLAVWTGNPCDTFVDGVAGNFIEDSLAWQEIDTLAFKIRGDKEFPPGMFSDIIRGCYSPRSKELAWSGSRYLLISETGEWRDSKIWFDVLSDSGTPINSFPTIIDNGDSVRQIYPTCVCKDGKFFAVWQASKSGWDRLYGIEIDTLGEIGSSSYLPGVSNKIQPSITSGGDKLLLVWADDRNGDFDIYGMFMDSIVGVEEKGKLRVESLELRVYPNPFTRRTEIRCQIPDARCQVSLKIYDLAGRLVKSFPINNLRVTSNEIIWDSKNDKGNRVSPGVYFCILSNEKHRKTTKLILMR
ncbi:T9SS type A sorting domain-containing protein [candidate division WOR-3 bacterium]|nr:T9SS type A sorting domain-containing protein [candidate division WOR-3 bacterium]